MLRDKLVWIVPSAALAIALTEMPYGYYVLLRLLVCGLCLFLALNEARNGRPIWVWILGGVAVLYNPILRIHLNRELWSVVNVATILLLVAHMWSEGTRRNAGDQ